MSKLIRKGTQVCLRTTNGGECIVNLVRDYRPTYAVVALKRDGGHFVVTPDRLKSIGPVRIGEYRDIIRSADFRREWLCGGTSEEFRRQDVGPDLQVKIAELRFLQIPARFADDIRDRDRAIASCERTIARWEQARANPPEDTRVCTAGGPRHVFLGSPTCTLCGAPSCAA